MDSSQVRKGFQRLYRAHREHGEVMPLTAYQEAFTGFEEIVAEEFRKLEAEAAAEREKAERKSSESGPKRLGHYTIESEIGRGGQGQVFLATDSHLDRPVALKVLGAIFDRSHIERFKREAAAVSRLDHPGICPVYDAGEENGTQYIAMRYVDGQSLAELIRAARDEQGAQSVSETVSLRSTTRKDVESTMVLVEKAARALHVAHEAGLVHRDIKPANIMVDKQGEPVVLDFGLARDETGMLKSLTIEGDLLGTPAYMSPEQLLAQRITLDRRTDVYSLGVTLYECLTLRRPFEAPTREALYKQILTSEIPDPTRINRQLTKDLKVVIETACDKDRDRRYQTALDLAEDLRRVREFKPIRARPIGPLLRFRRWTQRRPALATAVFALFLLLAVGLAISIAMLQEVREREAETRAAALYARALALGAESEDMVAGDPVLSLLLAREAVAAAETPRTRSALYEALAAVHQVAQLQAGGATRTTAHLLQGDRFLLHAPTERAIRVFDFEGKELERYETPYRISKAWLAPDQERFVTAGTKEGEAHLWRIGDAQPIALAGTPPSYISFPRDRSRILGRRYSPDSARLWNWDGELLAAAERIQAVQKTDRERLLMRTGTQWSVTDKNGQPLFEIDGKYAAGWGHDRFHGTLDGGTVRLYDEKGALLAELPGEWGDWSDDGSRLRVRFRAEPGPEGFDYRLYTRDGKPVGTLEAVGPQTAWQVRGGPPRYVVESASECVLRDENGEELARFPDRYFQFTTLDPGLFATVSRDGRWARIRGADGKEIAAFPTTKEITGLYQNGDRVITRGQDGVRLWDARGSPIASLPKGSVFVPSYHDAPYIYSWGPDDDVFRLLDRDGLELAAFHGHDGRPVLSGFSSDRRRVVTTSVDGTARIWEITPSRVPVLRGHRHPVREAWFLAGGSRILTRSWQGYTRTTTTGQAGPARIFETSGQPVALLVHAEVPERDLGSDRRGITDPHLPSHAHVDGKGERILTISVASYTARLWDAAGRLLSGFEDTPAYAGEFLADGRILLHVKTDTGTGAEIWDRSGRKQTKLGAWKPKGWVQFRPRSSRQANRFVIMPTEETKTAQLLDRDGRRIRALEHAGHVTRIGGDNAYPRCWFLPRGDRFALITNDDATHILTLFDRDGKKLREVERYEGPTGLTVSADTDRFATWLEEGTEIDLWDRDGKRVAVLKHDDPINEVVLLEGGERLLAFSESATTATFWNIADGARVAVVENVPRAPTKIAIMPGSENVLPVLGLLTVPVWGRDGTVFGELQGHTRTVTDVACSPDGRWIVTASADGTARVWDTGGELHHTLRGHGGAVRTVAFTPDGTGILTTSDDGTARVWPVDFAEVKRLAEEAAFRNFTASERVRYADLLGK